MDISVKAAEEVPGRLPGSGCPRCRTGMLMPVIKTESGDNDIYGPDGRSWCRSVIDRLACNGCSSCFEVAKEFRELDLQKHLEDQLKGYKNPAKKPRVCRSCRRYLVQGAKSADNTILFDGQAPDTEFLYCYVCFKIQWLEVHETESHNP